MDPGNWATSLAGGSKFGYALLSVALVSNIMAIILQSLCTRLGVGAGHDIAQACREALRVDDNRAKNVVCIETSRVQPIDLDNGPLGFARTVESELRIELENPDGPECGGSRAENPESQRPGSTRKREEGTGRLHSTPTRYPPNRSRFCCRVAVPSTISGRRRRERSETARFPD